MTTDEPSATPVCSRCRRPQPPSGPLRSSDGTPISAATYLAIAGLAGDALVCNECLSCDDVQPREQAGSSWGLRRVRPTGYRETVLDELECRRLLATQPFGRLAYTEPRPVVRPAPFVVRGGEIILAGLAGGWVDGARRTPLVAFEVDAFDAVTGQGWWVCALGSARVITDARHVGELDRLRFTPWGNTPDRGYIAIDMDVLRGTRLRRQGRQTAAEPIDGGRC